MRTGWRGLSVTPAHRHQLRMVGECQPGSLSPGHQQQGFPVGRSVTPVSPGRPLGPCRVHSLCSCHALTQARLLPLLDRTLLCSPWLLDHSTAKPSIKRWSEAFPTSLGVLFGNRTGDLDLPFTAEDTQLTGPYRSGHLCCPHASPSAWHSGFSRVSCV